MLNSLFIFWCMTYNNNGVELLLNKYHTEQLYRAPEERRLFIFRFLFCRIQLKENHLKDSCLKRFSAGILNLTDLLSEQSSRFWIIEVVQF